MHYQKENQTLNLKIVQEEVSSFFFLSSFYKLFEGDYIWMGGCGAAVNYVLRNHKTVFDCH